MEGKIIYREASKVVGMSWTGPYSYASEIREKWKQFEAMAHSISARNNGSFLCPFNDRETDFTYYITAEVENFDNVPEGMYALTVPPHKYAVFTHVGPMSKVEDTYMQIFTWLKDHGQEKDFHAFSLELYDERYNPGTDGHESVDNAFDIYVPIK